LPATWLETRDVQITDLVRYPGNARQGNVAEIQASLRRHGQYRSLVVRDTGTELVILAGNHTRDALLGEGHETARCEIITCTEDEGRRINLADNRMADLGTYDNDALAELLASLDGDYDGTGWDQSGLDSIQALLQPPDLDDLGRNLGDPGDRDTWPTVKFTAPHHVVAAWNDHVKTYGDDEAAAFAQLLGLDLVL
jgi:hypothetical protein